MQVPRLGVKSELQLVAYTTATAMPDPSRVYSLHQSSWVLNSMSEARAQTHILLVTSRIPFCCAALGMPANGP